MAANPPVGVVAGKVIESWLVALPSLIVPPVTAGATAVFTFESVIAPSAAPRASPAITRLPPPGVGL